MLAKTLTALALTGAAVLAGATPALADTPAATAVAPTMSNGWNDCHWQYNGWQHRWYLQCTPHRGSFHPGGDRDDHGRR
jgi:hypothetical protein